MKKTNIFLIVGIIFFMGGLVLAAETADKILAVVNKHVITQLDMKNYLEGLRFRLAQKYQGKELEEAYSKERENALADLIGDILIVEEARRENIEIPQEMIEERFLQFRKNFSSLAEFNDYLRRTGISISDIKKKIKRQLLIREFINVKIRPEIEIKPSEITAYYKGHPDQFRHPAEIEYDSLKFNTLKAAQEALGKIKDRGFEQVKNDYQQRLFSGRLNKRECRPELLSLFSLNVHNHSDIIEVEGVYFIFFIRKITPETLMSLKEAKSMIWNVIYHKKFTRKLDKLIEDLKKKAVIKIYAEENNSY